MQLQALLALQVKEAMLDSANDTLANLKSTAATAKEQQAELSKRLASAEELVQKRQAAAAQANDLRQAFVPVQSAHPHQRRSASRSCVPHSNKVTDQLMSGTSSQKEVSVGARQDTALASRAAACIAPLWRAVHGTDTVQIPDLFAGGSWKRARQGWPCWRRTCARPDSRPGTTTDAHSTARASCRCLLLLFDCSELWPTHCCQHTECTSGLAMSENLRTARLHHWRNQHNESELQVAL